MFESCLDVFSLVLYITKEASPLHRKQGVITVQSPMVQDNSAAPATKEDVRILMNEMAKLYEANFKWKEELKEHFNLVTENQLYDFKGIFSDRTEDHERRIKRLERKAGIAA